MTKAERDLLLMLARAVGRHLIWSLGGNRNDGIALMDAAKKVEAEAAANGVGGLDGR